MARQREWMGRRARSGPAVVVLVGEKNFDKRQMLRQVRPILSRVVLHKPTCCTEDSSDRVTIEIFTRQAVRGGRT